VLAYLTLHFSQVASSAAVTKTNPPRFTNTTPNRHNPFVEIRSLKILSGPARTPALVYVSLHIQVGTFKPRHPEFRKFLRCPRWRRNRWGSALSPDAIAGGRFILVPIATGTSSGAGGREGRSWQPRDQESERLDAMALAS